MHKDPAPNAMVWAWPKAQPAPHFVDSSGQSWIHEKGVRPCQTCISTLKNTMIWVNTLWLVPKMTSSAKISSQLSSITFTMVYTIWYVYVYNGYTILTHLMNDTESIQHVLVLVAKLFQTIVVYQSLQKIYAYHIPRMIVQWWLYQNEELYRKPLFFNRF